MNGMNNASPDKEISLETKKGSADETSGAEKVEKKIAVVEKGDDQKKTKLENEKKVVNDEDIDDKDSKETKAESRSSETAKESPEKAAVEKKDDIQSNDSDIGGLDEDDDEKEGYDSDDEKKKKVDKDDDDVDVKESISQKT